MIYLKLKYKKDLISLKPIKFIYFHVKKFQFLMNNRLPVIVQFGA